MQLFSRLFFPSVYILHDGRSSQGSKLYLSNALSMKKFVRKKCRKMFLEAIFLHLRKLFSEYPYRIFVIALHDVIGIQNFLFSLRQS